MSYSVNILKKSAFQDELMNVLESENAKLKMGNLAHGIVVSYFKNRIKELDEQTKQQYIEFVTESSSTVEHCVWDAGVAGSNPVSQTIMGGQLSWQSATFTP